MIRMDYIRFIKEGGLEYPDTLSTTNNTLSPPDPALVLAIKSNNFISKGLAMKYRNVLEDSSSVNRHRAFSRFSSYPYSDLMWELIDMDYSKIDSLKLLTHRVPGIEYCLGVLVSKKSKY